MGTIVVWVLVIVAGVNNGGGPMVIDNIASRENCEALSAAIQRDNETYWRTGQCVAVRKAVS